MNERRDWEGADVSSENTSYNLGNHDEASAMRASSNLSNSKSGSEGSVLELPHGHGLNFGLSQPRQGLAQKYSWVHALPPRQFQQSPQIARCSLMPKMHLVFLSSNELSGCPFASSVPVARCGRARPGAGEQG